MTLVIFPPETTDSSLANPPIVPDVPPTPTTSSSGGVVYSDPEFRISTLVIFPSDIIGTINPSLPVKSFTLGLRR